MFHDTTRQAKLALDNKRIFSLSVYVYIYFNRVTKSYY